MPQHFFVSNVEFVPSKLDGFSKLNFYLFDKGKNNALFTTSSMTDYNAKKYEKDALNLMGCKDWLSMIYSPYVTAFTPIFDEKHTIVGLMCSNGVLLKNEVKSNKKVFQKETDLDDIKQM